MTCYICTDTFNFDNDTIKEIMAIDIFELRRSIALIYFCSDMCLRRSIVQGDAWNI